MKKMILACIAVAAVSTNCSAAEVVGTANTMASAVATVTSTATNLVTVEAPVVDAAPVPAKSGPAKWWGNATKKYDQVIGGREAIASLEQQNADLTSELRILKAKTSFVGANIKPFSTSLENLCFLWDAGGIKEVLGGDNVTTK